MKRQGMIQMWKIKLWLVYLWRIRPRLKFPEKQIRKMTWKICDKTYDPVERQKLVDAIFDSKHKIEIAEGKVNE